MSTNPHAQSAEAVIEDHDSELEGLTAEEARRRRVEHGANEIVDGGGRTALGILATQFDSVLIWVLIGAAVLSIWAGHAVDAVLITVIVLANGAFGFLQDYRAERSLEALRELTAPTATVRRDGEPTELDATELVPGDIIELTGGDVVPADARLVAVTDLRVDEASLTGESEPVSKDEAPVALETPLAERECMVYKGTAATRGKGVAVVTDTGMRTEVGEIAGELAGTEQTKTHLQEELDSLGRTLGIGVIVLSAVVGPILLLRGTEPVQAALTAVSLAVAAVPEGLPAVVTLTLALGVRKMADENALVRRLPAVEALGAVDVICTDKTGTLTEGRMTVSRGWVNDEVIDLEGTPDDSRDVLTDRVERLLRIGALCNDATMDEGDPTERALVDVAGRWGVNWEALRTEHPRTGEEPFSSETKWMGTAHDDIGYVKGAPEVVLDHSDRILTDEGPVELTPETRERVAAQVDAFADDALRVLAMAYMEEPDDPGDLEEGLVFVGILGMIDPPREGVADAIAATERAGIGVKMVTGDNVRTARAIAAQLGLGTTVLEGADVEAMDDETLRERVDGVDVFARTSPEHKVRILRALQDLGHEVAMTGDGVNDAPALKNADVGVAMGVRGTDVARQSSDIVLLDDDYTTIERAVERGRAIFDNVWKFVAYLLSANVAEVAIVFLASLVGYLILPAVQLLWINLLTDGLPALALGADPESGDVMDRPPRDPDGGIVDRSMLGLIGGTGTVTTILMLALMFWALDGAVEVTAYAMTMVFTAFVVLEFGKLYVIRWLRETPALSNKWLVATIGVSLGLQLSVLYTPLNRYFGTVPLEGGDWFVIGLVALIAVPAYFAIAAGAKRL